MTVSEILILCLTLILCIIALIYVGYFHYLKIKKIKEQIADDSFDVDNFFEEKKDHKTRNVVLNALAYSFLVVSLIIFTSSIILKGRGNICKINNQYIVQIASPSMAENEITNTYLKENNVKNKLYVHDLIAFNKVKENEDFKLMDILLYKTKVNDKEVLIAHRLLKINDDGTLILRGDANKVNDPLIKKDDVIGTFSHRLEFLSLVSYMAHMPSYYVTFATILIIALSFDLSKIYIDKEIKNIKLINN